MAAWSREGTRGGGDYGVLHTARSSTGAVRCVPLSLAGVAVERNGPGANAVRTAAVVLDAHGRWHLAPVQDSTRRTNSVLIDSSPRVRRSIDIPTTWQSDPCGCVAYHRTSGVT